MTSKNTNYRIKIKSEIFSGEEKTELETIAQGNLYLRNGKYYIIYDEPDATQMKDCTTTIKTDLKTVSVKRGGSVNTNLDFELNTQRNCLYRFEFGTIIMETKATVIEIDLSESGGRVYLEYHLDTGGEKTFNKLELIVKEK